MDRLLMLSSDVMLTTDIGGARDFDVIMYYGIGIAYDQNYYDIYGEFILTIQAYGWRTKAKWGTGSAGEEKIWRTYENFIEEYDICGNLFND